MADPFSIYASRAHIHHTGQYSRDRTISVPRSHSPTRTCMHACTQAVMRACTRVRLHTQTHRHTHCHSMPSHVASAVACAYGGVRDSVQMRRCSRRQRCRQILRARWPRRTLLCAQARQRSCESRRHVNSARAVALGTQCVDAECRSTSRRSMDSDPAACDTGEGDTGRVRPPKPMRQPCCTSSQGARVMLRRRAVRSLVQHAARVQSGRWVIATPWGTAECTRSHPSFVWRSPRLLSANAQTWRALRAAQCSYRRYAAAAYVVA